MTNSAKISFPWQTLDQQRQFLQLHNNLAGRRVLILGDNAGTIIAGLLATGTEIVALVSHQAARERIARRFPEVTCEVRQTMTPIPDGSFHLAVIWDATRRGLNGVIGIARKAASAVWACSLEQGWIDCTVSPPPDDLLPDCIPSLSLSDAPTPADSPLVTHVHMPKNGGTSTNNLLFESFGYLFVPIYTHDPRDLHTTESMEQAVSAHPHMMATSSHSFRVYPPVLAGRPVLYFTFLRRSIDRHLSYYRYARKFYDTFSEGHRKTLPANFMEMSPKDYLAFESSLYKSGVRFGQLQNLDQTGSLDNAKSILSQFLMVGVLEEAERGIRLLRKKLSERGIELVDLPIPHSNTTRDLYGQTSELERDPSLAEAADYLKDDVALYEWARDRFETEARRYGV